jgi:oligopeptide transport system permease protein
MFIAIVGVSVPSFVMAALLQYFLGLKLFMATGMRIFAVSGWGAFNQSLLPVFALGLGTLASISRLTRTSMLDVLGQDYIRTAKAKGVSGTKIIFGHALKNSLIPVITYLGPMLAYIVTGSLVVEQIFAVPGIGRSFVSSITNRDYTLIMGTTIVLATLIVVMNLIGDIMYKVVDPRINLE